MTPDPPPAAKPVPEADTLEMLMSSVPVFFRVTGKDDGVPTSTLPKVRFEVLGESCGAAPTPVPDKLTVNLAPLVPIDMLPEEAPADLGAKEMVKLIFRPGPIVMGVGNPA